LHRLDTRPWPLPGADGPQAPWPVTVEPDVREHLLHLYGCRAGAVLAPAADDVSLLERLHPDGPDIVAQARFAAEHEWARTPADVLRRRTTVTLRGLEDEAARATVTGLLGLTGT
jgi:glycerol-3-phosphate dehydrogenase